MIRTPMLATGLLLTLAAGTALQAQPAPPPEGPGPDGPGMMMQDPLGDATIARKDAEAQAAARFTAMDANADGTLSADELRTAWSGRAGRNGAGNDGPGNGQEGRRRAGGRGLGGMAGMLDTNGDGQISRDEFMAVSLRRFDMADANHDGQLTRAERQSAMEERMRAMMANGMGSMGGGND